MSNNQFQDDVNAALSAGRWQEAADLMENKLDIVRLDSRLSWSLGWAHFKLERFEEAVAELKNAVSIAPDNAINHWALGAALEKLDRVEEAEAHLRKSLDLREGYTARILLAFLYQRTGRVTEAEAVHLEGIRLRPNERERHEAFADFLSDQGRSREAQRYCALAGKLPTRDERRRLRNN